MKRIYERMCSWTLCATVIVACASLAACSDDEDDAATTGEVTATTTDGAVASTPAPQSFNGEWVTSLPSMPSFEPLYGENSAVITWQNAEQTLATVKTGAFTISTSASMGNREIEIGEMTITDVACVKEGGQIVLSQSAFECQAGDLVVTGSLVGSLADGKLSLTLLYKPGSMPYEVQSVFESRE